MPNESERIDEAVLAVLSLTLHEVGPDGGRAWKSIAFEAMDRLHERGLIDDPKSKNKSVWLTPEGVDATRAEAASRFGEAGSDS